MLGVRHAVSPQGSTEQLGLPAQTLQLGKKDLALRRWEIRHNLNPKWTISKSETVHNDAFMFSFRSSWQHKQVTLFPQDSTLCIMCSGLSDGFVRLSCMLGLKPPLFQILKPTKSIPSPPRSQPAALLCSQRLKYAISLILFFPGS